MPVRFDAATFKKPRRLPNGYLRADATLTRTGVFEYRLANGTTRREFRPAEEVFHADSLESFALVPLTSEHPDEALTAENTKRYQIGHLGENPRRDGDLVVATAMVTDADAVKEAETGIRTQLSCGYNCELDHTPGTWNGERYDAIQRKIRGNHVALVSKGRAGPEACLRLDSADDGIQVPLSHTDSAPPSGGGATPMQTVVINGISVEVSPQAAQALAVERSRLDAEKAKLAEDVKAATAKADKEAARADALKADFEKAEAARKDAADPDKVRALIQARVALEKEAAAVLGEEEKLDSLGDDAVKGKVLAKLCPDLKLDGKSADYVQGRYEHALEAFRKDAEEEPLANVRRATSAPPGTRRDEDEHLDELDSEAHRAKWMKEAREMWKRPAMGSTVAK